jgi:hypothetical protein
MNSKYPEANTTASEEGTAAHWVLSEILAGRTPVENTLTPNGVAVTQEMLEGAVLVQDTMDNEFVWGDPTHIEETVNIPTISPDCFGTPDVWQHDVCYSHLRIIDYKFGHGYVDEYWNPQGLLYMAGIIATLPTIPTQVSFTIVQPRCYYKQPVRTHTYYINHAGPYLRALREAAERATLPTPTATTGPQCKHCPGRHACPTLQRAASLDSETSTDQQPVDLTPSAAAVELRMLERALLRLEARVTGLRELTTANIRGGAHVPHYKLEPGRSSLKWTVPDAEVIKLGKKLKVPLSLPKIVTPTQAKKLLLDDSIIAKYADIIPGALKLVESSNSDANKVFKEI